MNLNTILDLFTEKNTKESDAFFVLNDILAYGKESKLNVSNFKKILNSIRTSSSFHGPINIKDYSSALKNLLKSSEMLLTLYDSRYLIKTEVRNIVINTSSNRLKEFFKKE